MVILSNQFLEFSFRHGNFIQLNYWITFVYRSLPASFCNLSQLVQLQISNNQLQCLPKDIDKLRNLRTLLAFSNEIKILPGLIMMVKKF